MATYTSTYTSTTVFQLAGTAHFLSYPLFLREHTHGSILSLIILVPQSANLQEFGISPYPTEHHDAHGTSVCGQ